MKRDGKPTMREMEIGHARIAGYHDDSHAMVRSLVERKTASHAAIQKAFQTGLAMRKNGIKCNCFNCKHSQSK